MKKSNRLHSIRFFAAFALFAPTAWAQQAAPFVVNGTAPSSLEFRADGFLMLKAPTISTASLLPGDQGAGMRFFWHPRKGALRAGLVSGNQSDEAKIGDFSTAFGNSNVASGYTSTAIGGYNAATGAGGVAIGLGNVGGNNSAAIGYYSSATGEMAAALGCYASASGGGAVALGFFSRASGYRSLAAGNYTVASGHSSASFNASTQATACSSVAMGRFNVGAIAAGGDTTWIATDPLLELGNGTSATARSNALTVYKNGSAVFQGVVNVAPGGDIPMYTGN